MPGEEIFIKLRNTKWKSVELYRSHLVLNKQQGVYAIGIQKIDRISQLAQKWKWAYVGISKNIKARLKQHLPQNERKRWLRKWMFANIKTAQVMYRYTNLSQRKLKLIEKEYIESKNPIFNILKKRKKIKGRKK